MSRNEVTAKGAHRLAHKRAAAIVVLVPALHHDLFARPAGRFGPVGMITLNCAEIAHVRRFLMPQNELTAKGVHSLRISAMALRKDKIDDRSQ